MKGPRGTRGPFLFSASAFVYSRLPMNLPPPRPRLHRAAITFAFLFLAAIHFGVIAGAIRRAPHVDETEQLQGSIMLARGERIYTDFAEHHPLFLFELLSTFAPVGSGEAALDLYLIRARALAAVFGTIAFAVAAWIVWKASGRAYAVLIFVALVLSQPPFWGRAFAEVRSEPPSLACGGPARRSSFCRAQAAARRDSSRDLESDWLRRRACGIPNGRWPASSLESFFY